MADSQQGPSIVRLLHALREEKIRFVIVGMSSAVLQGVPVVTFDTDIWIDLPARQYMRPANICLRLGATMRANTVFVFPDDTMVNFLYAVTGLRQFGWEFNRARRIRWLGMRDVPVLPLERIYASKDVIRRPKDLAHMELLKQAMSCARSIATRRGTKRAMPRKPRARRDA